MPNNDIINWNLNRRTNALLQIEKECIAAGKTLDNKNGSPSQRIAELSTNIERIRNIVMAATTTAWSFDKNNG